MPSPASLLLWPPLQASASALQLSDISLSGPLRLRTVTVEGTVRLEAPRQSLVFPSVLGLRGAGFTSPGPHAPTSLSQPWSVGT